MRKFREGSEGECLLHTVNVNESQSRTCQANLSSPTGVGVRKFKETSEASTYIPSGVRVDVGLCESHFPTTNVHSSTLSTHEIKKGQENFSHRGGVRKFRESSR